MKAYFKMSLLLCCPHYLICISCWKLLYIKLHYSLIINSTGFKFWGIKLMSAIEDDTKLQFHTNNITQYHFSWWDWFSTKLCHEMSYKNTTNQRKLKPKKPFVNYHFQQVFRYIHRTQIFMKNTPVWCLTFVCTLHDSQRPTILCGTIHQCMD